MSQPPQHDVTQLLLEWSDGDGDALDHLMPLVYEELRGVAHRYMRRERNDHTLSTTALVHEAYLKLVDQHRVQWQNRAHFFAIAAQAMRRILLMYARKRKAAKRGGGQAPAALDENMLVSDDRIEEIVALDEALTRLAAMDERLARVVEYRYFGGLTIDETAEVMGLSSATIKRDWRTARAWLFREMGEENTHT